MDLEGNRCLVKVYKKKKSGTPKSGLEPVKQIYKKILRVSLKQLIVSIHF